MHLMKASSTLIIFSQTAPQLNVQANLHVYILFPKPLNLKQYKNE